jgi:hypothetical protein
MDDKKFKKNRQSKNVFGSTKITTLADSGALAKSMDNDL